MFYAQESVTDILLVFAVMVVSFIAFTIASAIWRRVRRH